MYALETCAYWAFVVSNYEQLEWYVRSCKLRTTGQLVNSFQTRPTQFFSGQQQIFL